MIKSVKISNENDFLYVPFENAQEEPYFITNIEGLGPVSATVNNSENSFVDGGEHISSHIGIRPITIYIQYNNNANETVEELRDRIVSLASVKKEIRLDIETSYKKYFIYGIVEKNEQVIFSYTCGAVISMLCPYPFFRTQERATATTSLEKGLTFPIKSNENKFINDIIKAYYIDNNSTQTCFPTIRIKFIDNGAALIEKGIRKLRINYHYGSNVNSMLLNFGSINGSGTFNYYDWVSNIFGNDELIIETEPGKKSIRLYRSDIEIKNVLYMLDDFKYWISIVPDSNRNSSISFDFLNSSNAKTSLLCLYNISWYERYESI